MVFVWALRYSTYNNISTFFGFFPSIKKLRKVYLYMNKLHNENEIEELIKNNAIAVVYFTGNSCSACEVIKVKIEEILKRFPRILGGEVNGEENISLAIKYDVYSVPVFILFIEGRESIRIGRNVDLLDLEKSIGRYYHMLFN